MTLSTLNDFPVRCWKLNADNAIKSNLNSDLSVSHVPSISFMTDIILSLLISKEIPHNLLISDKGQTIYIFPRKFADNKVGYNSTWLDLSGLPLVHNENLLNEIKQKGVEVLEKRFDKEISIDSIEFDFINHEIIEKFKNQFEVKM